MERQTELKNPISKKRLKLRVECFLLCEAKIDYVYDFIIYTGKKIQIPVTILNLPDYLLNQSSRVILSLMKDRLDKENFLWNNNSNILHFDY